MTLSSDCSVCCTVRVTVPAASLTVAPAIEICGIPSSSVIVTVAVPCPVATVEFVVLPMTTSKVSFPSANESSLMGTVIVFV